MDVWEDFLIKWTYSNQYARNVHKYTLKCIQIWSYLEFLEPINRQEWETNTISSIWKQWFIIKLPKKGVVRQWQNWRSITFLNILIYIWRILPRSYMQCPAQWSDQHQYQHNTDIRVRWGCPLSALLFNILLDRVLTRFTKNIGGFQ